MSYQVEEKEVRECFKVVCWHAIEYIYAYTLEEAEQICLDKGYMVL